MFINNKGNLDEYKTISFNIKYVSNNFSLFILTVNKWQCDCVKKKLDLLIYVCTYYLKAIKQGQLFFLQNV